MPYQVNFDRLFAGLRKWWLGLVMLVTGVGGGSMLMMEGCTDVRESVEWVDEDTGTSVVGSDGESIDLGEF